MVGLARCTGWGVKLMAAGTDSPAPTYLSFVRLCTWHHWSCTKAHPPSRSFHHRKIIPPRPCERGIISAFVACLLKDKLLVAPEISSVPSILILLFSIRVPCTDSCHWLLPTSKFCDEYLVMSFGLTNAPAHFM
jgi:hypothetical protein